ncbi:leucyl aminopeptidase family protein [Sphingomicrobium sp. XHP0235]|uniref:leucyl aminopeptidase family protein n=1 Tax=Sphingomicrobium aquimarinum TaxID=3133971 RepID=UPI0031FF099D
MTDLLKADQGQSAHTIHLVDAESFDEWIKGQPQRVRSLLEAARYDGKTGYAYQILPGAKDDEWAVVTTVADVEDLSPWCLAKLGEVLPEGSYRLANDKDPGPAMLGWILAQHRFDAYLTEKPGHGPRTLLTANPGKIDAIRRAAEATLLVRDMVDTPPEDMGPAAIEQRARDIAERHSAKVTVTAGDALEQGYPMIHAVGRAATRSHAPRLVEVEWGDEAHPRLAIVGKGVSFDSGGLDIKSSKGMALMKKDMGGSAHALALAQMVMDARLPVRLHLLIPTVENAIAGNAFRPGDVLKSRKGITVEIDNTDAEGRLILGDALAKAGENKPDFIIDFATLTGAARVALGPDLPVLFANDDAIAETIEKAGSDVGDPLWRLPLWDGYDEMLSSSLADMVNSGGSGFAGSITAALFLRRFVPDDTDWIHFDTFAWRPAAKPGRPKGGEALGLRAAFALLEHRYGS